MTVTPCPITRVPEKVKPVEGSLKEQVSPLQVPPRESGHTVEPLVVVIDVTAWASDRMISGVRGERASKRMIAIKTIDRLATSKVCMMTHWLANDLLKHL